MNTNTSPILFSLLAILLFVISCSKKDAITTPTFNYSSTTIEANFYEEGNSKVPNVEWNGNEGLFSLKTTLDGLSINQKNGVLSWTKLLPNGTHQIEVSAINSRGETNLPITLNNTFQGIFTGIYATCFSDLEFKKDGTFTYKFVQSEHIIGIGSWVINGEEIIANYTIIDNGYLDFKIRKNIEVDYSLKGNLIQDLAGVTLSEQEYLGKGAVTGQEIGSINNAILDHTLAGDGAITQKEDGRFKIYYYGGCGVSCCYATVEQAKATDPSKDLYLYP